MAQTGALYPYDATLNPNGYRTGSVEQAKAKQYWDTAEHTNDANNPFPVKKDAKPGTKASPSASSSGGKTGGSSGDNTPAVPKMVDDTGQEVADGSITVNGKTTTLSDEYGKAYKDTKYLAEIRQELINNKQLDPKTTSKKAVLKAYQDILVGASVATVPDVQAHLSELVNSGFVVSAAQTAIPSAQMTAKGEAYTQVNTVFDSMFSEPAPADVKKAYFDELAALEKSRTTAGKVVNGVRQYTSGVSDQERKNILNKYVKTYAINKIDKAVAGDKDAISSLTKGSFGVTFTSLKNAYADNGISYDLKSLANMTTESTLDPNKFKSNLNLINISAKQFYPALADKIDLGYSVKQLLSPYIQARANILEEDPDTIDLKTLTSVAKDPKQMMGLYDYEVSLRNDPKWRFTKNAQDTMSGLANSLAKTFGLVG